MTIIYKFENTNITSGSIADQLFGHQLGNFLQHNTSKNSGGNNRFRTSSVIFNFFKYDEETAGGMGEVRAPDEVTSGYIISVGVADSPEDWAGPEVASPFALLNPTFKADLQQGKALLLLDQSLEGYHRPWLWDWFHNECHTHLIPAAAVIYLVGNQAASDDYIEWCITNSISDQLKIIPSITLANYVRRNYDIEGMNVTFDGVLAHKKTSLTKLYDCINYKPRRQRLVNFLHLLSAGLLDDGRVGIHAPYGWPVMQPAETRYFSSDITKLAEAITPMWIDQDPGTVSYGDLIGRIRKDVYDSTWVSIVTESSYYKYEQSVFISEKTFKPIAAMQPFIILGSKGTLKYLRKLGYKTFDGFIDESYDECEDDNERFTCITSALKKIKMIEDKSSWYESMREILEHNHNLFLKIGKEMSEEHSSIIEYYTNYFKDSDAT